MSAYYNEFDPKAAEWLRELIRGGHIADGVVDERSIIDVAPDDLDEFTQCHFFAGIGGWSYALRLAGVPDNARVWTGSPPCQPFSVAGNLKGKDDDRHLAPHFLELVAACRPPVLFGEQVASADVFGRIAKTSGSEPANPPAWAWLDDVSDSLEAAHYAFGASDIPAAGIGAPHIRQRTFFGAVTLDTGPVWLANIHDAGPQGRKRMPECTGKRPAGPDRVVGESSTSSPINGFWGNADWLFCRDGKWRPVEPGTFPVANGIPDRVGLLRGYGNAINPWAAKIFIEAMMDAATETFPEGVI